MECPLCRSTDLQKLSVIYNSGFFDVRGHSTGIFSGDFQIHRGIRQNRLSQIAAPPKKRSYLRTALLYVLCFYVVGAMISLMQPRSLVQSQRNIHRSGQLADENHPTGQNNSAATDVWWGVLASTFVALLTILMRRAHRHNRNVYPTLRERWNSSFMCLRCGAIAEIRK